MSKVIDKAYMPQLDTLRTFAVLLVITAHWMPAQSFMNKYTANGILGVTLFFVLSGFLITGILLKSKNVIDEGGSIKNAFKTFYLRRALRIFPLYYFVLILAYFFNTANIRENFIWHFFYASNFYFWKVNHWQGHLSHLWSLSVEEQFYLFWPALILFIPRKKLPYVFLTAIGVAIIFRLKTRSQWTDLPRYLTPGSLDSFGFGALLAYGQLFLPKWYILINKYKNHLAVIFLLLFVFATYWMDKGYSNQFQFLGFFFPLISVFFALVINLASQGITNPYLAPILNNKALIYLGKISYGLYIYHNFLPHFGDIHFPIFLEKYSFYIVQFIRLIALIGIASLSWFLFEKPILRVKKYLNYPSIALINKKQKNKHR